MKKRILNGLLIILIAAIVLYFVLRDNLKEILFLTFSANLLWIIISILLDLSYSFFKGCIIHKLVLKFDEKYKYKKAFSLQLMSNFFNAATPFSTGGQPFQIYMLNKDGLNLTNSTGVIVGESIIHQTALILMGTFSILMSLILGVKNNLPLGLVFIGLAINGIFLLFLIILGFSKKFASFFLNKVIVLLSKIHIVKNKEATIKKWQEKINNFNESSKLLLKNKKETIGLIGLNILAYFCLYLVPLTVVFSLGGYHLINGIEVIILANFVAVIGSFVPLPGGSGGQEYAFITLFGAYVVNPTLGSLMLIWRFITYYLSMIVGAIILGLKKEKI